MQKRLEDVGPETIQAAEIAVGMAGLAARLQVSNLLPDGFWVQDVQYGTHALALVSTQSCGTVYRLFWNQSAGMWCTFQHDSTYPSAGNDGDMLMVFGLSRCRMYSEVWKAICDVFERLAHDTTRREVLGTYVEVAYVPPAH